MGYFRILGNIVPHCGNCGKYINYKGLYRREPCIYDESRGNGYEKMLKIQDSYDSYTNENRGEGIDKYMTLDELFCFAEWNNMNMNENFEVVFFDHVNKCDYKSVFTE